MISWAALNHQWRGLKTPPKKRVRQSAPEPKRYAGIRARLRKQLRRMRRLAGDTFPPLFERRRALLARLDRGTR